MLFVALYSPKTGVSPTQTLSRRMEWKPPEGIKVVAEYWLQHTHPRTIAVFEADNYAPMMAVNMAWSDLYDITVVPAITGEEGLKLAKKMKPKT